MADPGSGGRGLVRLRRALLLAIALAAIAVLVAVLVTQHNGSRVGTAAVRSPTPRASATVSPSPTVSPNATPVDLVVPAAGIDAAVESVGLTAQGDIGVPAKPADAAWYDQSVAPGQPGNAILDGHLDWWTGPAVFIHLSSVKVGDTVTVVSADGRHLDFAVTGRQVFGADDRVPASMLATSGPATLSLITCAGAWDQSSSEY
ncbi:MAG: class F sortase, partial [Candidatus Dormibacteraceae bacterium]